MSRCSLLVVCRSLSPGDLLVVCCCSLCAAACSLFSVGVYCLPFALRYLLGAGCCLLFVAVGCCVLLCVVVRCCVSLFVAVRCCMLLCRLSFVVVCCWLTVVW